MRPTDSTTLVLYNTWANQRIREDVRKLNEDQFIADLKTSHRSVRGTLIHILWAEWLWLRHWHGESPKVIFGEEEFRTLAAIEDKWLEVESQAATFVARVAQAQLDAIITYENMKLETWSYTLAHMIQHTVNHSTYHRGQIVTLLRQLGREPRSTDLLIFFDERRG